jgi:MYND finger
MMHPTSIVSELRVGDDASVGRFRARSDKEWRELCNASLRQDTGTVKAVLVDPFVRSLSLVEVQTEKSVARTRNARNVSVATTEASCKEALGLGQIGNKTVLEDVTTGRYITCVCKIFKDKADKEPGFTIGGRVFVGRALLLMNIEVWSPNKSKLDYSVDATMEDVDVYVDKWLSVKEAIRARAEFYARCHEEVSRRNLLVIGDQPPMTPTHNLATCWGCGEPASARRKCSRCLQAYYCSEACQKQHWVHSHKSVCKVSTNPSGESSRNAEA